MPSFGPVKRKDLLRAFSALGFEGPYSGGRHQFMVRGEITYGFPTRMRLISGGSCWQEFSGKLE